MFIIFLKKYIKLYLKYQLLSLIQLLQHIQIILQLIHTMFECPICLNILLRPVTLTCGHNFCEQCIKNEQFCLLKQQCPVCRKLFLVNLRIIKVNLLLDIFINEYFKNNKEYQQKRNQYYDNLKQKKLAEYKKYQANFGNKQQYYLLTQENVYLLYLQDFLYFYYIQQNINYLKLMLQSQNCHTRNNQIRFLV
ncbi:zinc finger protein, putative [Ichthyophthirius multifiliis]|uniref:Zinc finger protein, putative n=1 Tax=Ichthyophthirius multifiliis TaxID=5932 RepID=G0QT98_ICHMU|nr:zinc finger protein, putative [Ichthyophthirius multifiliis]EGR31533.1 zinc finger protein, putative [Ichthyophthirius multifiliis]|eukprot:XP_004035019.1 zinc finger protein, putative [Ichthyophthirius multifiliis]